MPKLMPWAPLKNLGQSKKCYFSWRYMWCEGELSFMVSGMFLGFGDASG